ncbi:MAG: AAA family ATPase [Phycisphaerales bacterium]|nr:AAA family ATPase [Phycisphaerales bacterium]
MISAESNVDVLAQAAEFQRDFEKARVEVAKTIVGQGEIVDAVLTCLFVGGHVLLEGVPGIGKTLLVRTLAQATSLTFSRVQFTPDLMPADITGTTVVVEGQDAGGRTSREFRFRSGPLFAQIVLADEINRATPKTQSALLEAMQERGVTVGGETHKLPEPFLVMATQNPVEQEGTYPLPEAQLDRFFFKLLVKAPSREDLAEILERTTGGEAAVPTPTLDAARILAHRALIRRVPVAPSVRDYAVRLVLATQPTATASGRSFSTPMVEKYVRLGASPRAAQALILAGKCRALRQGRANVATEDIADAALAALRHRLIMNFEASAEGVSADSVVANIVQTLPLEGT